MTPCAGLHELFDSTEPVDHMQAKAICKTCPVIDWCRTQVPPSTRFPAGTWAGRLYREKPVPINQVACRQCEAMFPSTGASRGRKAYCSDECRRAARSEQQRRSAA